jgi:hypothetical protein
MTRWTALFVLCLSWAACIPFDEDGDAFCVNVEPRLRGDLCPSVSVPDASTPVDAGTQPDAGPEVDAGTPGECVTAADCPARAEDCQDLRVCTEGRCEYRQQEDGAPCSGPPAAECRETTGTCRSGVCQYTPRTTGPCNDGQPCTVNDVCRSGGVCAGTLLDCDKPPRCMKFAGTCSNNKCNYVPAASGTACSDDNMCTTGDYCDGEGRCLGPVQIDCPDRTSECLLDPVCSPSEQCVYTPKCTDDQECRGGNCCPRGSGAYACPSQPPG